MRVQVLGALLLAGLVLAPAATAQESRTIAFAAYFRCDQSQEARADTIFRQVIAPIWQKHVTAGRLTTFGWGRHWAGGDWRRIGYMVGTDLNAIIDARAAYIEEVRRDHAAAVREFNRICPSHDDYIWYQVASSQAPQQLAQNRPAVGMTSYMVCDSREGEADEIIQTAFAPILNRHVQAGDINSWSWLEHNVGGKYRRALVLDAANYKAMLGYWNKLWEDIEAKQPELLREFSSICHSHTDYIWDLSPNP